MTQNLFLRTKPSHPVGVIRMDGKYRAPILSDLKQPHSVALAINLRSVSHTLQHNLGVFFSWSLFAHFTKYGQILPNWQLPSNPSYRQVFFTIWYHADHTKAGIWKVNMDGSGQPTQVHKSEVESVIGHFGSKVLFYFYSRPSQYRLPPNAIPLPISSPNRAF